MNTRWIAVGLLTFALASLAAEPPPDAPIDWGRARQLYQRERSGGKLSPEEQAYLDRAKAERAQRAKQNPAGRGQQEPPRESTGLVPLTNKTAGEYNGFATGLYGAGLNEPPAEHLKHAQGAAAKITPLDREGRPDADNGRFVLLSVGMSNTTQEFSQFVRLANADPAKNAAVAIVDGAQGGRAADDWASKDRPQTWQEAERRLAAAKVTPSQVQVLWIKQARKGPASLGAFPKHAQALQADLKNIVLLARERYPNLKLVYLSSRTYGGYASTPLNPEPYAYESAFSVQWLIRSQIDGADRDLAYAKAPVLLWGPYLWTDGTKGRDQDALVWTKEDVARDGTHPSDTGRRKVAELLLAFFKSDPTAKGWFVR